MAVPSYLRSSFGVAKRIRICPHSALLYRTHATHRSPFLDMLQEDFDNVPDAANSAGTPLPTTTPEALNPLDPSFPRLPRNVQAIYLRPLRRTPTHGLPVCDLQLRSFSTRQLTLAADFALRAAYYLNLPAKGPVPLPRITERWTVPKSNFVHKKSQENFERVTLRRLIQIQDADPEGVQAWLGFLMKYCVSGVGMKANVWECEGVGERRGLAGLENMAKEVGELFGDRWRLFGKGGNAEALDGAVVNTVADEIKGVEGAVVQSTERPKGETEEAILQEPEPQVSSSATEGELPETSR
ncbi:MAG: mitochondrial 37S ribosomal protein rsm10 [Bogoriella megaspora]|nr:MAG: mitochondrial 37S ribosomal protein rsm10 [Bogoriella megaspora]